MKRRMHEQLKYSCSTRTSPTINIDPTDLSTTMAPPSPPPSPSRPPSSPPVSLSHQLYCKKMVPYVMTTILLCVVAYDAILSYQYSITMRQLMSMYPDTNEVPSSPYDYHLDGDTKPFKYYDPNGLDDVRDMSVDDNSTIGTAMDGLNNETLTQGEASDLFGLETSDGDSSETDNDHKGDDERSRNEPKATTTNVDVKHLRGQSVVNEDSLLQNAIRDDEPVSLYRSYEEYSQRSKRFPSVEERVKLYMSTWYNPPIFPCNSDTETDLDHDPRIHYNYITRWNEESGEHVTTIVLRQSQSIPVDNHDNHKRERLFTVDNLPQHTRLTFAYNYTVLSEGPYKNDAFIQDAFTYFTPSLRRLQYPDTSGSEGLLLPVPILLQVGDSEQFRMHAPDIGHPVTRPLIPVIKKFRYSMEADELKTIITSRKSKKCNIDGETGQPRRVCRTVRLADNESLEYKPYRTQPIISIMSHTKRHFGPLSGIPDADRPWHTKLNMAVYRGALTGMAKASVKHPDAKDSSEEDEISWCMSVPRCNLVLQHGKSTLVNAKLTKVPFVTGVTEGDRVKPVLNGVVMEGESMNYNDMLEYKAIIMLEGNDVASGLKWALYSNSVVMMSTPTCTSWAMEELLQPYVHYIPINDDLSNVEEQVQWMMDHDEEAEQIATNGRLWMTDLIFHPDAAKDTDAILDETFRRYMQHFRYNPLLEL